VSPKNENALHGWLVVKEDGVVDRVDQSNSEFFLGMVTDAFSRWWAGAFN
jgi:hypothetical protein